MLKFAQQLKKQADDLVAMAEENTRLSQPFPQVLDNKPYIIKEDTVQIMDAMQMIEIPKSVIKEIASKI